MISLLRKLIRSDKDRLIFAGIVVIAANSGGAWTPIGDVTTTMLWMGGQITTLNIMTKTLSSKHTQPDRTTYFSFIQNQGKC